MSSAALLITAVTFLILMAESNPSYSRPDWAAFILGGIIIILSVAEMVCSIILIINPSNPQSMLNGLLITLLLISFLTLDVAAVVFAIIALCKKDKLKAQKAGSAAGGSYISVTADEFAKKAVRFKQYLTDGIITEKVFKEKILEFTKTVHAQK